MRWRNWLIVVVLLVVVVGWIAVSALYPMPEIRLGMTEQEVESLLGQPIQPRTHDEGHSGVGVYSAVPRWLLGRNDWYIITYDLEGRVAHFDLIQVTFFNRRWTHQ